MLHYKNASCAIFVVNSVLIPLMIFESKG